MEQTSYCLLVIDHYLLLFIILLLITNEQWLHYIQHLFKEKLKINLLLFLKIFESVNNLKIFFLIFIKKLIIKM